MKLLDLRLSVDYAGKPGALRNVAIQIGRGEVLGLVGESGSGKSTLALSIMGLLEGKARGNITFNGHDLLRLKNSEMRGIRGREIAMVLQSPIASLNPALRIGTQMAEAWRAHAPGNAAAWRGRALACFQMVSLPDGAKLLERYPRKLSVGEAQRVLIAMAILHRPRLLIADEPTSSLDAITASEVLALFRSLNRELNVAVLFISHELRSVGSLCDRLAILKSGEVVESGPVSEVFRNPKHEYTRALLQALPQYPFQEVTNSLIALSAMGQFQAAPEPEPVLSFTRTSTPQ